MGSNGDLRVILKVNDVIKDRNMTQKDLAEVAGIRPNTVSMLARGYVERLSLSHIEDIANALNITDIRELIDLIPEEEMIVFDRRNK